MSKKTMKQILTNSLGRRRFVTLRGKYGHDEVDLEMPGDLPIGQLLSDLIKALNWPIAEGDQPLHYLVRTESGRIIQDSETLLDAGVENSDVLWITLGEDGDPEEKPESYVRRTEFGPEVGPVSGFAPVAATNPSPKDRRGTLAPPRSVHFTIQEPSLISAQGLIFVLGNPPLIIGRSSGEHQPDIDLTEIDTEIVSSRNHAEIHLEEERLILIAKQTTNGTFVNGVELLPEEKHTLEDGDTIQFGFEGVELTFLSGDEGDLPASFFQ
jgi:uncharacterized ubiquitin-like protein YukD